MYRRRRGGGSGSPWTAALVVGVLAVGIGGAVSYNARRHHYPPTTYNSPLTPYQNIGPDGTNMTGLATTPGANMSPGTGAISGSPNMTGMGGTGYTGTTGTNLGTPGSAPGSTAMNTRPLAKRLLPENTPPTGVHPTPTTIGGDFGHGAASARTSIPSYYIQYRYNYPPTTWRYQTTPQTTTPPTTTPKTTTPAPTTTAPATPKPTGTTTAQPANVAGAASMEEQMVRLVNTERSKAGLPALAADPALTKAARAKSQDMINKNYFSHESPTYGSPFDMLRSFGITYRSAGENIALNQSTAAAHTALMNSTGHKANILGKQYSKVGIGVVKGSKGYYFTQLFTG